MFFILLVLFIIIQRIVELTIARKNEKWMKEQGAIEYGKNHYKWMVLVHVGFFISLMIEVIVFQKKMIAIWPFLLSVFFLLQIARVWVIASLGKFWNTKIIVLPGANIVTKGPYKYIKHPNYFIVTLELLVIPIMFQAYVTALCFLIFNQIILSIRISAEEKALREQTNYSYQFK